MSELPTPTLEDFTELHAEMVALNRKISERLVRDHNSHNDFNLQAQVDALQKHIDALKGGK